MKKIWNPPFYPMMVNRYGIQGLVKVRFLVTEAGRVEIVSIADREESMCGLEKLMHERKLPSLRDDFYTHLIPGYHSGSESGKVI